VVPAIVGIAWAASLQPLQTPPPRRGGIEDLRFTVRTDKIEYAPGETVQIVTNLTNIGDTTATIVRGDSCAPRVGFWNANGTMVFLTDFEKLCLAVIVETPLAPGQSMVSSFTWEQQNFTGNQVPSGRAYRVGGSSGGIRGEGDSIEGPLWAETWFFILPAA